MVAINPEMIKLARESRGLNQNELCNKLGVAQGTISKIENGLMQPSQDLMSGISKELNYPETFFAQRDNIYAPSFIYYRRRISMSKKSLAESEAKMNIIRLGVERLLDSIDLPETNLFRWDVYSNGSPEEAAMLLRERWKLPKGKIDNLTKVVEDNGVIVVAFDFGADKIDGISFFTEKNHPIIFVNNKLTADRHRLTVGHELGHLILHFGNVITEERDVESEAFRFSSELLVPTPEFRRSFEVLDIKALANMKLYWKVSMASLITKAKQVGSISENQAKYLWSQISAKGYRLQEPIELNFPKEQPSLINEMIKVYKEQLDYSNEDLMKLVNLNFDDFQTYFNVEQRRFKIVRGG